MTTLVYRSCHLIGDGNENLLRDGNMMNITLENKCILLLFWLVENCTYNSSSNQSTMVFAINSGTLIMGNSTSFIVVQSTQISNGDKLYI